MGALGRVELPTNGLGNRCSIHLSYRAACRNRLDCFSLQQPLFVRWSFLLANCEIALSNFAVQQSHRLRRS